MRVRTSGAWKEVSGGRVRVAGAWKNLVRVRAYIGGAWKDVASFTQPLTALTITPDGVFERVPVGDTFTSPLFTASPTGGRTPIQYAWSIVTGSPFFSITSPNSASTRVTRFMDSEGLASIVLRCTATDADGLTALDSIVVDVEGFSGDF